MHEARAVLLAAAVCAGADGIISSIAEVGGLATAKAVSPLIASKAFDCLALLGRRWRWVWGWMCVVPEGSLLIDASKSIHKYLIWVIRQVHQSPVRIGAKELATSRLISELGFWPQKQEQQA